MSDPIHLHTGKLYKNSNLLLLIIPAILFFVVIGIHIFLLKDTKKLDIAKDSLNNTNVLGEEVKLDKSD